MWYIGVPGWPGAYPRQYSRNNRTFSIAPGLSAGQGSTTMKPKYEEHNVQSECEILFALTNEKWNKKKSSLRFASGASIAASGGFATDSEGHTHTHTKRFKIVKPSFSTRLLASLQNK
jgi:hypothetical protein